MHAAALRESSEQCREILTVPIRYHALLYYAEGWKYGMIESHNCDLGPLQTRGYLATLFCPLANIRMHSLLHTVSCMQFHAKSLPHTVSCTDCCTHYAAHSFRLHIKWHRSLLCARAQTPALALLYQLACRKRLLTLFCCMQLPGLQGPRPPGWQRRQLLEQQGQAGGLWPPSRAHHHVWS